MDATHRVFGIYELAEKILIYLSLYDLLLATVTCQNFQRLVLNSTHIRKRLQNEHIPVFAKFRAGDSQTEDLCNINEQTPWLFRSRLSHGLVIVLKTANENIQLYVPDALTEPVRTLDSKRTRVSPPFERALEEKPLILMLQGASCKTMYKVVSWAEWYDGDGNTICSKYILVSRFKLQKPDKIWDYLTALHGDESAELCKVLETKAEDLEDLDSINFSACLQVNAIVQSHTGTRHAGQVWYYDCLHGWMTD